MFEPMMLECFDDDCEGIVGVGVARMLGMTYIISCLSLCSCDCWCE